MTQNRATAHRATARNTSLIPVNKLTRLSRAAVNSAPCFLRDSDRTSPLGTAAPLTRYPSVNAGITPVATRTLTAKTQRASIKSQ